MFLNKLLLNSSIVGLASSSVYLIGNVTFSKINKIGSVIITTWCSCFALYITNKLINN